LVIFGTWALGDDVPLVVRGNGIKTPRVG